MILKINVPSIIVAGDLRIEFIHNGLPPVIALYFITVFSYMNVHNTSVSYLYGMPNQSRAAQEGIHWTIVVIPAILMIIMIVIISFHKLTNEKIDEIHKEIERCNYKNEEEET
ncbi:hypothetical protein U3516DRAFT_762148 [Neocallimastix sp. 'constans']